MRYAEDLIGPMRQELTRLGVQETRTPEAVDAALGPHGGTVPMVINAMGGCAAGRARPGIALALRHAMVPDPVAPVFAGGDLEATARARLSAGLSALLAIDGSVPRWPARVHVASAPD
jgi:bacilliredoxin